MLRGDCPDLAEPAGDRQTAAVFARERAAVDDWLVDFCEALHDADLCQRVMICWPDKTLIETLADALLHVFLHGQHHRGQIHAMLSGSSVQPPQIDQFILRDDGESRVADLQALGWTEARLTR